MPQSLGWHFNSPECPEGARGLGNSPPETGGVPQRGEGVRPLTLDHTPPASGHPLYLRGGVSVPIIESETL